jgi:TRAP-type C4-dicarboxylate transport system substrate-binding protein
MQTGVIDGADLNVADMLALQIYQVATHLTRTEHVYIVVPFFIADRFLEKVSEGDQAVILETGRAVPANMASICAAAEQAGLLTLAEKGMNIQELTNRDAFADLVKNVPAEFADSLGGAEFLELMKDAH